MLICRTLPRRSESDTDCTRRGFIHLLQNTFLTGRRPKHLKPKDLSQRMPSRPWRAVSSRHRAPFGALATLSAIRILPNGIRRTCKSFFLHRRKASGHFRQRAHADLYGVLQVLVKQLMGDIRCSSTTVSDCPSRYRRLPPKRKSEVHTGIWPESFIPTQTVASILGSASR